MRMRRERRPAKERCGKRWGGGAGGGGMVPQFISMWPMGRVRYGA